MAVNQDGLPVRLILTAGQHNDITQAKALVRGFKTKAVLADKGYVSKKFRRSLLRRKIKPVIPPKADFKRPYAYDKRLYKRRNRIERAFNKLKHFRRLAQRFDRNDAHYLATVTLAATSLWLRFLYVDSA
jgi:transposase